MPRLRLLSFNCLGVPALSTRARLRTLARLVDEEQPDVVCLQEIQLHPYLRLIRRHVTALPHTAHEPFLHAPKGGLVTLSRLPVLRAEFELYRHRGWWHTPSLADWLLHKGFLATHHDLDGQPVIVINTHLVANYDGDWTPDNRYARAERAELAQLAAFLAGLPDEALLLVAGDFNLPRGSWLYDEFVAATGLLDPLADSRAPTYRPLRLLPDRYAEAIDHVYVRPPGGAAVTTAAVLRFDEPVPLVNGRTAHLSDHLGVELTLCW